MPIRRTTAIVFVCALLGGTLAAQGYVPNRVFDAPRGTFTDFETMAADLAAADVVFIGEQHDDVNTHRLELAVLEALARRKRSVVVSLEMFERDVQEPLDHFQMGHMDEAEFLKVSAAMAALQHRLQAAGRSRHRAWLAGRSRQRAAADCGGDRQGRTRGA